MSIAETSIAALEPFVGRAAADTCVRGSALSMGKFADSLEADDLPGLEANIRSLLGPIVPGATITSILDQIRRSA